MATGLASALTLLGLRCVALAQMTSLDHWRAYRDELLRLRAHGPRETRQQIALLGGGDPLYLDLIPDALRLRCASAEDWRAAVGTWLLDSGLRVEVLLDQTGAERYTVQPVRVNDTQPTLETLQASVAVSALARLSGVRVIYRAARSLRRLSDLMATTGAAAAGDPWRPLRLPGLPLRAAPTTRPLTRPATLQSATLEGVAEEEAADAAATLPALPAVPAAPSSAAEVTRVVPVLTPIDSPVMAL